MKIEVMINDRVEVDMDMDDVIDCINSLEEKWRWNAVFRLLDEVNLNELDERYHEKAIKFLKSKLEQLGR